MPAIKCSDCGFRILHPDSSAVCPNCGFPLQMASGPLFVNQDSSITPTQDTADAPMQDTPSSLPAIIEAPSQKQTRADWQESPSGSFSDTGQNPGIPINPFSGFVSSDASFEEEERLAQNKKGASNSASHWKPDHPLLFRLGFQRPPEIEGVVIQSQAQEEPPQPGMAGMLGRILMDIFWSLPNVASTPDKDKIRVTTVRVRTEDGMQRDIRMEGHLTGVNVALGDVVSLWGYRRKGLLIFSRGYNHTSQGPILTTSTGGGVKGTFVFLLIVVLLLFIVFANGWLHWPPFGK